MVPSRTGSEGVDDAVNPVLRSHPLQRISSPSYGVSLAVHTAGLASFASSYKFLIDNPNAMNEAFGWHLQFLTIIGLTLSTLTFIFGLLADLTSSRALFTVKNALSVASTPMEVLISLLYWGLSAIDKTLVVPPELPPISLRADIGFHLAPTLFLITDLLLLSPPWSITTLPSIGLSGGIATAYWFWVEACYKQNGFYPYPIFDSPTHLRLALFAGAGVTMAVSTYLLKAMYRYINGVEPELSDIKIKSERVRMA